MVARNVADVTLSLLTDVRTEEARALQWSHVVAWVEGAEQWQPIAAAGFDRQLVRRSDSRGPPTAMRRPKRSTASAQTPGSCVISTKNAQ
jgi:hypothetical protein